MREGTEFVCDCKRARAAGWGTWGKELKIRHVRVLGGAPIRGFSAVPLVAGSR